MIGAVMQERVPKFPYPCAFQCISETLVVSSSLPRCMQHGIVAQLCHAPGDLPCHEVRELRSKNLQLL